MNEEGSSSPLSALLKSLAAGAAAGLTVDLTLYPVDTIKTRLQSHEGFRKSGGFSRLYAGIPSVAVGSAPGSALFFVTYDSSKRLLSRLGGMPATLREVIAANVGEILACLVRVPTEVIKQRSQAFPYLKPMAVLRKTLKTEGISGLYRGYRSTLIREIPFSSIQFPLWEGLKRARAKATGHPATPLESAICGCLAGGFAAAVTTPLDVAKTRIMLAHRLHTHAEGKVLEILKDIWTQRGIKGLYAGLIPRCFWIGVGGFLFLGAYEKVQFIFSPQPFQTEDKSESKSPELRRFGLMGLQMAAQAWTDKVVSSFRKEEPKTFDEAIQKSKEFSEKLAKEYEKKRAEKTEKIGVEN